MDFRPYVNKYKDEIIEALKQLVKINSILDFSTKAIGAPFGKGIYDALAFMEEKAQKDGFKVLNDEGYCLNITLEGMNKESIAVLGHLDTVPVDKNWKHHPFGAEIEDGKMYGRGTTDDKGPVIAAYYALKILKDENIKLNKSVELLLGTDEETGWRGIEHYASKYALPEIGFSPDAEWPLINGEKGILRMDIKGDTTNDFEIEAGNVYNAVIGDAWGTTKIDLIDPFYQYLQENNLDGEVSFRGDRYCYHLIGKTAHAMSPEIGINAGLHLARFFNEHFNHPTLNFMTNVLFEDYNMNKLGMRHEHPVMGLTTLNVGIIRINEKESYFTFDIRYPEGFKFAKFKDAFKNILACYNLDYDLKEDKEVHYIDPESNLVKTLLASYAKYTNESNPKPRSIGGGTYAKVLKQGVAFGLEDPNKPSVCHISDEYIELDRLFEAVTIYLDAIYELCK